MKNTKLKTALLALGFGMSMAFSSAVSAGGPNQGNICSWLKGQCESTGGIHCSNYAAECL